MTAIQEQPALDDVSAKISPEARPVADRLAVIVPVYNEDRTVAELLRRLEIQPCISQIIIVDDGSTDRTWDELEPWRARASFQAESTGELSEASPDQQGVSLTVLRHDKNRGKGRAIRTGLGHVTCSHVIIQDADLEYDPADISQLWAVMLSGQADAVFGSRYLDQPRLQKGRKVLQTGVRLLNVLTRLLYGVQITDQATCYKLFRTGDLQRMNLQCERFDFCAEVTSRAIQRGAIIREVPIRYHPRSAKEGKKLRLIDGVAAMRTICRLRLGG